MEKKETFVCSAQLEPSLHSITIKETLAFPVQMAPPPKELEADNAVCIGQDLTNTITNL